LKGKYPLGRFAVHLRGEEAREPLPKLIEEFLKFVLSSEGQKIVIKDGYGPLPAKIDSKQLGLLK